MSETVQKPYTAENAPDEVKRLPSKARSIWIAAFNNTIEDEDEGVAFRVAWSAVRRQFEQDDDGKWTAIAKAHYLMAEPPTVIKELPWEARALWIAVYNENVDEKGHETAYKKAWGTVGAKWKKGMTWASRKSETEEMQRMKIDTEKALSLQGEINRIRAAFHRQFLPSDQPGQPSAVELWVKEVFADHVIVDKDDGLWSYPYTETENTIRFGIPVEVEQEYREVTKSAFSLFVPIAKLDIEKRLVYGIVLEPNTVDSQKDIVSPEEIERACHKFMLRKQHLDYQHERVIDKEEASIVECYIAPNNLTFGSGGDSFVKAGSWVMAVKIFDDDMWNETKAGDLNGFSIKGRGMRRPLI